MDIKPLPLFILQRFISHFSLYCIYCVGAEVQNLETFSGQSYPTQSHYGSYSTLDETDSNTHWGHVEQGHGQGSLQPGYDSQYREQSATNDMSNYNYSPSSPQLFAGYVDATTTTSLPPPPSQQSASVPHGVQVIINLQNPNSPNSPNPTRMGQFPFGLPFQLPNPTPTSAPTTNTGSMVSIWTLLGLTVLAIIGFQPLIILAILLTVPVLFPTFPLPTIPVRIINSTDAIMPVIP